MLCLCHDTLNFAFPVQNDAVPRPCVESQCYALPLLLYSVPIHCLSEQNTAPPLRFSASRCFAFAVRYSALLYLCCSMLDFALPLRRDALRFGTLPLPNIAVPCYTIAVLSASLPCFPTPSHCKTKQRNSLAEDCTTILDLAIAKHSYTMSLRLQKFRVQALSCRY